jgi:tetratricopeptide (TPR) repeat protein
VPVEVTERAGGFVKAWETGARTWREHSSARTAAILPVHAAWALYEPVGLPGGGEADVPLPSREALLKSFSLEARKLTSREILPQVAQLEAQVARDGGSAASRNRLGVLYSRIGEMGKAEAQFQAVLLSGEHAPALVNLGNIRFLAGDLPGALALYERARKVSPANATVLLAVARTQHSMEAYGDARISFDRLRQADPRMAEQFAYLGSGGEPGARAAAAAEARRVIWSD